jgi:hypothetical protein
VQSFGSYLVGSKAAGVREAEAMMAVERVVGVEGCMCWIALAATWAWAVERQVSRARAVGVVEACILLVLFGAVDGRRCG